MCGPCRPAHELKGWAGDVNPLLALGGDFLEHNETGWAAANPVWWGMLIRELYNRHLLPHLIDLAMGGAMATRERQVLIPQASGVVLEIGVGSGLNLPFYGPRVRKLYALEPHPKLLEMAVPKARQVSFPVEFIALKGEDIPLGDHSVDTVVSTWTLCSIADPGRALQGMLRVLKPGGRLLFVEHGRAPSPRLARWQDRLNGPWSGCAGGCQLNRSPDILIQHAGFNLEHLEKGYLDGPKLLTYHYKGVARRA